MSVKDILLIRKLGFGILSFTGALVVLLGGWILVSAMTDQPQSMEMASSSEVVIENADRSPDSVVMEPVSVSPIKIEPKVETVSLGCLREGGRSEFVSQANQVRLKAKLCGGGFADLKQSSLINRATGFEATLFNLKNGVFTSDYLPLSEGANQLFLQVSNEKGEKVVAEVTISRPQSRGGQPQTDPSAASSSPAGASRF